MAKINQTLGYGTENCSASDCEGGMVMDTKMKQSQRVYEFMKAHGSISQRDAVQFGCYRLSARIHDLRADGHVIKSENKSFKGEFGRGHYAVYSLVE